MVALVTLDDVKRSSGVTFSDDDQLLAFHVDAASAAIIRYMKSAADDYFDEEGELVPENIPDEVRHATIYLVGVFYRNPDGDDGGDFADGMLPKPVRAMLSMLRDPALA